jgi:MFS family permease
MATLALAFAVLDISSSPGDLGLVLAARSVPFALFMLYGGVIGDRFPRRLVLIMSSLVSCATHAAVAALLLSGAATVPMLMAIEAVNGAATAFTFPALQGIVPQVVDRHSIQQANALLGGARNVSMVLGPVLGGVVVATSGPAWALAANALISGAAAVLFLRMSVASRPVQRQSLLGDLRAGWREFSSRTWVWSVVCVASVQNALFAAAWMTLGPVVADGSIGRAAWGFVLAAQAAGLFAGTFLTLWGHLRFPLRSGVLGIAATAPALATLAMSPSVVALAIAAFVAGLGMEVMGVGWQTALQTRVPEHVLSRVASYDALGSFVAIPVGQLLAVPLSHLLGTQVVIFAAAVLYVALSAGLLLIPSVRSFQLPDARPAGREPVAGPAR